MNRLQRLTALMVLLQTKRVLTAQELSDRFEVSVRTIYRDIRTLEAAGMPIGSEAGVGYFLVEGYQLPPVHFTQEEASAMLLAEKFSAQFGDHSVSEALSLALEKIRAILRYDDKDFLERLDEQMLVRLRPQAPNSDFPNHFLTTLQAGLAQHHVMELAYYSPHSQQHSQRKVNPIGLLYYSQHWHLIGWCHQRSDYRDFRTDRIKELRLLNDHFDPQQWKNLREYLVGLQHEHLVVPIRLRIHHSVVRFLQVQKFSYGFFGETQEGEWIIMDFFSGYLSSFSRWVLMMGDQVEIVYPDALKAEVHARLQELERHYLRAKN